MILCHNKDMAQVMTNRFVLDSSLSYRSINDSPTVEQFLGTVKRASEGNENVAGLHSSHINADFLHMGYYNYLKHCWSEHAVAVISPEILWQILMSVTSERVASNPELYRSTFTHHKEKTRLVVHGHLDDLEAFASDISNLIVMSAPDDISLLVPEFSTSTTLSRMSRAVALMNTTSPFYHYGMKLCGLTAIEVRGTESDWTLLNESWRYLTSLLQVDANNTKWLDRVDSIIENVVSNHDDIATWQGFFTCEGCGSESDVTLGGWITDFAFVKPGKGFVPVNAMPSAVATADFVHLPTNENFRIFSGILGSKTIDDLAEPVFGFLCAHLTNA